MTPSVLTTLVALLCSDKHSVYLGITEFILAQIFQPAMLQL